MKWYGEAVVRRQILKITSGDVMSRVPRFPAVALLSTTGKYLVSRTLHYVSMLFTSRFNAFFAV